MANIKITDLTAYTDPLNTDVLPIVDVTSDTTKKVSIADLLKNASAGTAAAPGIAFDGDNTGIYSPGADQLALATNGTGRLFIDASGNVGVGADATTDKLETSGNIRLQDVAGTIKFANDFVRIRRASNVLTFDSYSGFSFYDTLNTTERLHITSDGKLGVGISSPQATCHVNGAILSSSALIALSASNIFFDQPTSTLSRIGVVGANTSTVGTLSISQYSSNGSVGRDVVHINSLGNVGIGTVSPSRNLTVSDGTNAIISVQNSGLSTEGVFNAPSGGTINLAAIGSTDLTLSTNALERVRLDSSGRLLVGTTTEGNANADDLTISNSGNCGMTIRSGSSNAGVIYFSDATSGTAEYDGYIHYQQSAQFLSFGTAATERARLDSSGRLLVGTSTAFDSNAVFEAVSTNNVIGQFCRTNGVEAAVTIQSTPGTLASPTANNANASIGALYFRGYDSTAWKAGALIKAETDGQAWASGDCPGRLVFSTTADGAPSPTPRMTIKNDGKVGIGTASPQAKLEVNGDAVIGTDNAALVEFTSSGVPYFAVAADASNYRSTRINVVSSGGYADLSFDAMGTAAKSGLPSAGGLVGNIMYLDASTQRVGIGSTSPDKNLVVNQSNPGGDVGIRIKNNTLTDAGTTASLRFTTSTGDFDTAALIADRVTGSLRYEYGGQEKVRLTYDGKLLVGTSTARNDFFNITNWTPQVQLEGTTDQTSAISLTCNKNSTSSPVLIFAKTRGTTVGADGLVSSGDLFGYIGFMGNDGAENVLGADIKAEVDGTPGANDMPGRLVFSTTADGALSPTERMRITSDAYVRLASGTGGIQFNGDTAAANALDDYEEGTWTPVPSVAGATTQPIYTSSGRYLKIGKLVHLTGSISVTTASTGGASQTRITGIPFSMGASGSGLADFQPQFTVGAYSAVSSSAADSSTPTGAYVYEAMILLRSLFGSTAGGQVNHSWNKVGNFSFSLTYYLL